jgi:hypothetical protein
LRNLVLILFFLPFFVAQDAHYLNYLHCRLVNIAQPVSQQCDCEQLLASSEKEQPPVGQVPATHVHAHLDVYFEHAKVRTIDDFLAAGYQPHYIVIQDKACTGFNRLPCFLPYCYLKYRLIKINSGS